ncbi:hypothetical protein [Streptomyces sp. NPDC056480]|uniref:hypothetical protein n=1 Tax=Streptomyces sp. NPDC056480 TaxID=3345833 RepID=UPI003696262F
MSVTDPQPPASDPRSDAAQEALHDRIAADSLTPRRNYLRIVATVFGGIAVASGILHRHGDSDGPPEAPQQGRVSFKWPSLMGFNAGPEGGRTPTGTDRSTTTSATESGIGAAAVA